MSLFDYSNLNVIGQSVFRLDFKLYKDVNCRSSGRDNLCLPLVKRNWEKRRLEYQVIEESNFVKGQDVHIII